jgi:hypothetical protein
MKVSRLRVLLLAAAALGVTATLLPAAAKPMWIGDCWGMGLKSKAGRDVLKRSNINYVAILARVEYMDGDIEKAFLNPQHRPWPWFDPKYRESLDSLIRKAASLGLKVQLNLDPGWTAVSAAFRERLRRGDRKPDEGSAWLFPNPQKGFTDRQIALYADLFGRTAAHCEKTYPGVVRWIEIGNDLGFPQDNYCKLVEAVTMEMKKRETGVAVMADALQGRLVRAMANGTLPDIIGFHHLPAFARPGSKYPSQAEIVIELRRILEGKRSYRGHHVDIWVDKWNPCLRGESMRDFDVWQRVADRLTEQQRLALGGSAFFTFCLDTRHSDPAAAWALSWNDGVICPGLAEIAAKIGELTGSHASSGRPASSPPSGPTLN